MNAQNSKRGPINSLLYFAVVKDDIGRFASKLKRDVFQIALCSGLGNLAPDDGTASKGDLLDIHVRRNSGANGLAIPDQKIEYSGRNAGLNPQFAHKKRGEGGERRAFH